MMNERERLIELLKKWTHSSSAVYGYDGLADYLLENGVVVLPCKVGEMGDKLFSHNEFISLWVNDKEHKSKQLWDGMAWDIPDEYKNMIFKRIFGTIPETIDKADTINILAEQALKGGNEND